MKSKKDDLTNLNILEELNRKVQIKKDLEKLNENIEDKKEKKK